MPHKHTTPILNIVVQQETDCFNATSLCRKESKLVRSRLHKEGGKAYIFFCAIYQQKSLCLFSTRGRHYQHYLLLVPLHYRSEWGRGFVAVLQHGNDVLCYLRWRQLPTPTGQEKLGPCYKTPTHHTNTQVLSLMKQDGSCHSCK